MNSSSSSSSRFDLSKISVYIYVTLQFTAQACGCIFRLKQDIRIRPVVLLQA